MVNIQCRHNYIILFVLLVIILATFKYTNKILTLIMSPCNTVQSRHYNNIVHLREYFGKGSLEQWMSNGIIRHLIIMTSQYNIFRAK